MAGIILEISVDDRGTAKIKQFGDESKKALEEMKKGAEKVGKSFDTGRESWIGWAAGAGIATAAGYAAKKLIFDMAPAIASAGNEIERMARNLNMSTDAFQEWNYIGQMAHVNIQQLGSSFQYLTRSMSQAIQGGGEAKKVFDILGISLKDSTGKTKDQEKVLMETIGALEKYADGMNRDAMIMNIFGQSWMSIKPLIDKGTKAIEENKKEAERLGLILGKDVVKSLSAADDAFKRFGMTVKVARMEFFDPLVKTFADLTEELLGLKRAWGEGGFGGVWKELQEQSEKYKIEELLPAAWTKEWVAGWTPPKITKAEAPALAGAKEKAKEEDPLAAYESLIKKANEWGEVVMARQELTESGWVGEKDIVEQVREEIERLEREANEWGEVVVAQQELVEAGWTKQISETQKIYTSLSENISSAWSSGMVNILKSTEDTSTKIKSFFQGIGDVFLSTVSKMITQWLLFGSATGKTEKGGGFLTGGSWGGILGSLLGSYQHGTDYVPRTGPYLLHQGEAVTPAGLDEGSQGSHGDVYYITHITAMDNVSFIDFCRRNPDAIIGVTHRDTRSRGITRSDLKRYF